MLRKKRSSMALLMSCFAFSSFFDYSRINCAKPKVSQEHFDTMFPRGGKLEPAPSPATESASDLAAENLFSTTTNNSKKAKKRRKSGGNGPSERDPVFRSLRKKARSNMDEEARNGDFERPIASFCLRKSTMRQGTVMLGVVVYVSKLSATVSLPCNLVGRIKVTNLSDQHFQGAEGAEMDLTKGYLLVGQLLRCCAIPEAPNSETSGMVELSTAASKVNLEEGFDDVKEGHVVYGTIQSVEDHGYVVDLGHPSRASGFLRFHESESEVHHKVGQLIEAVVTHKTETADDENETPKKKRHKKTKASLDRIVFQLDDSEEKLKEAQLCGDPMRFESLQVGIKVRAEVSEYLRDGIYLFFMNLFHGTVDSFHCSTWKIDFGLKRGLPETNEMVEAQILFIDRSRKQVGLTCAEHLLNRREAHENLDRKINSRLLGSVLRECIVRRIDSRRGLLLEAKVDEKAVGKSSIFAYARKKRIKKDSDGDEIIELDKKYSVGDISAGKVLSYAAIDGVLNVSLSKDVIEATVLRFDEVHPGMKVKGKIFKVDDFGALVALSDQVRGIVPKMHLSEVLISDSAKRFKVGQTVSCRVLKCDYDDMSRPKIVLTMKKTLVNSNLAIITREMKQIEQDMVVHGFVNKVDDQKGVYVSFYDSIFGRVNLHELAGLGIQDPHSAYQVSWFFVGCRLSAIV